MPCTIVVLVQNPMVYSLSSTLGSSILDEWESQIKPRPPFLNAQKCGKLNNVGRVVNGKPTLLTSTKGDELCMNDILDLICHLPSKWVT